MPVWSVDTNAETSVGACRIPVFRKAKRVLYISMADASNFACNVGLIDIGLGSLIFLFTSPSGSWTFSGKVTLIYGI